MQSAELPKISEPKAAASEAYYVLLHKIPLVFGGAPPNPLMISEQALSYIPYFQKSFHLQNLQTVINQREASFRQPLVV
jgi:hypothetical protein